MIKFTKHAYLELADEQNEIDRYKKIDMARSESSISDDSMD
jgi:hypothetical protein